MPKHHPSKIRAKAISLAIATVKKALIARGSNVSCYKREDIHGAALALVTQTHRYNALAIAHLNRTKSAAK